MGLEFEWDPRKETSNRARHGASFQEAASVFGDPLSVTVADPDHSPDEDRWIIVGRSMHDRQLMVAHTVRGDRIRIISARTLASTERAAYEEGS